MNRPVLPLIIAALALPLGCGGNDGVDVVDEPIDPPRVLQPSELCSANSLSDIGSFADANLEAVVRSSLILIQGRLLLPQDPLTCSLLRLLTGVDDFTRGSGIVSLVGIQNLPELLAVRLPNNSITDISPLSGLTNLIEIILDGNLNLTDISPLSGLTSLELLSLRDNSITDISALSDLTSLTTLRLDNNSDLSDIQPLLDNTGLGAGDEVNLVGTSVSCTDVAALEATGVSVTSDCL